MKKLTRKSAEMENGVQAYSWCGLINCRCLEINPNYGPTDFAVHSSYINEQRQQSKSQK